MMLLIELNFTTRIVHNIKVLLFIVMYVLVEFRNEHQKSGS